MAQNTSYGNLNYQNSYSKPAADSSLYNNLYNYSATVKQTSVSNSTQQTTSKSEASSALSSPAAVYSKSRNYSFCTYNAQGATGTPSSGYSGGTSSGSTGSIGTTPPAPYTGGTSSSSGSTSGVGTTPPVPNTGGTSTSSGSTSGVGTTPPVPYTGGTSSGSTSGVGTTPPTMSYPVDTAHRELSSLGYDIGEVNGYLTDYGKDRSAIARYQHEHGLEVTTFMNDETERSIHEEYIRSQETPTIESLSITSIEDLEARIEYNEDPSNKVPYADQVRCYDEYIKRTGNHVTVEQLKDFGWTNPTKKLAYQINKALNMFGINKGKYAKEQIITFMAITGHESGMGGYDYIQSGGDGNYRGAGAIQLTGEYNYDKFDKYLKDNLKGYKGEIMNSSKPYEVVAKKYAWMAAAWYWTEGKPIKDRLDEYMDKGYKLSDSFIVASAFVQGFRGSNEDYREIAAGHYKPNAYSSAYNGTYNGNNTYQVIDIKVNNGGTVISSNNWEDRNVKFIKACTAFGGH